MRKTPDTPGRIEVLVERDEDVIVARQKIRGMAESLGFSMLEQTRIVTAASELARNIVVHGGGRGRVLVERIDAPRPGIRIVFADEGSGIPDLDQAMKEGFSTVNSMGLGLKGARRLMDEFDIKTAEGQGTMVTVTKWLW